MGAINVAETLRANTTVEVVPVWSTGARAKRLVRCSDPLRLKSSTLRLVAGPDCKMALDHGWPTVASFLPSAGKDGGPADLALLQEGLTRDQR